MGFGPVLDGLGGGLLDQAMVLGNKNENGPCGLVCNIRSNDVI